MKTHWPNHFESTNKLMQIIEQANVMESYF